MLLTLALSYLNLLMMLDIRLSATCKRSVLAQVVIVQTLCSKPLSKVKPNKLQLKKNSQLIAEQQKQNQLSQEMINRINALINVTGQNSLWYLMAVVHFLMPFPTMQQLKKQDMVLRHSIFRKNKRKRFRLISRPDISQNSLTIVRFLWAGILIFKTSFRGVHFECTSVDDGMSKTLAIKQAPYSNKASIEDMGNEPLRYSINAIYSGSDYKQSMDALIAALSATGAGELIHPIHGIMNVHVNSYRIQHDANNVDFCSIAIEFVEAETKEKPLFIPVSTPTTIAPSKIVDTPTNALEKALDNLKLSDNNKLFETVNRIRNGLETARKYMGIVKEGVEDILSPKGGP